MYKEVIKGIDTKTRVRGSRVKYLHKPWTMGENYWYRNSLLGFTSGLYLKTIIIITIYIHRVSQKSVI